MTQDPKADRTREITTSKEESLKTINSTMRKIGKMFEDFEKPFNDVSEWPEVDDGFVRHENHATRRIGITYESNYTREDITYDNSQRPIYRLFRGNHKEQPAYFEYYHYATDGSFSIFRVISTKMKVQTYPAPLTHSEPLNKLSKDITIQLLSSDEEIDISINKANKDEVIETRLSDIIAFMETFS